MASTGKITSNRRSQDRTRLRQQKAAERIGAATEQLASGMTEASAAAEQLRQSLEQIAAGAEEAAGAAQESLSAVTNLSAAFAAARAQAEAARRRTEALQSNILETAGMLEDTGVALETASNRQLASADVMTRLEQQALEVSSTTQLVADVSDRTNLLALNAAIEAARAGDAGLGFAVVADEVRNLAEVAERTAREIDTQSSAISTEVKSLAEQVRAAADLAKSQTVNATSVTTDLSAIRSDLSALADSSQAILTASIEADIAAREAGRGAELVASAAEEQSSAVAEAQRAVSQQAQSLDESQVAAQSLATLADDLQNNTSTGSASEQVSSASEQLSATVQELSGAAGEILIAIDQISRGAATQASATQQTNAAMVQIEKSASAAESVAIEADKRTQSISGLVDKTQRAISSISEALSSSIQDARRSIGLLGTLEEIARKIEKSIDRIVLVTVQTSMLSVSGSVEAARTGDAGRGFAQVSSDIRRLAQDASENVEGVKDVVRSMQMQIAAVRRDLELALASSEIEHTKSLSILERMDAIRAEVTAIAQGNQQILGGAREVLAATREVQTGTQQIAAAAQEASSAAVLASTAAREQSRGSEDLAAAIEEIASLAEELQLAGN